VAARVQEALGPDRIRDVQNGDGWPAVCEIWTGAAWRAAHLYLGVVGPSGRRTDERRMQNPERGPGIVWAPDDHETLLLGLWDEAPASGSSDAVVVAWNPKRRAGRETRFSLFVPVDVLYAARSSGRSTYASASGEAVRAFSIRERDFLQQLVAHVDTATDRTGVAREECPMTAELDDDPPAANDDLEALAEKLASLSDGEVPSEFARPPSPFDAGDVDWRENDWLAKLGEVQAWLALESELDLDRGPEAVLETLFSMLEDPAPRRCFRVESGHAVLTDEGIASLGARLDTATALRNDFVEAVDSGTSIGEATRAWRDAWEETPAPIDDAREAVHAKVDTWGIYQFRDRAAANGLELNPSYQRGNVWTDKESSELIDSVLRGIPLPSIILNQRLGDESLEIVDGKQRLTSILRFVGSHPDAIRFVAQMEEETGVTSKLFHENYKKWRAAVRKHRGLTGEEERAHFLPFQYRLAKTARDAGSLSALNGKYYCEMKDATVKIQGREESIKKVFELPMTSYKLSVILYEDTDIHQIHKVFGLYNRQGKKLNATEVRNAIYHHLSLAKLLLLLAGDSNASETLAPYLASKSFDFTTIPEMLEAMNVSDSRFNRTKITSWVAALILHRLETKEGSLTWPGSTSLIEAMMRSIADRAGHPMRSDKQCDAFAQHLRGGAALLTELRNMDAFWPSFTHPGTPGEKWEDLPAVATWTACTLAAIADVKATPAIASAVRDVTKRTERLKKQQARSQWGYLARVALDLLRSMEVDLAQLGARLEQRYGHSCLVVLEARRA
jgi:hypothetical protein